jgi:hypothetical protein
MHRLIILSILLAVMAVAGCADNTDRADDLYRARIYDRHNPSPSTGW